MRITPRMMFETTVKMMINMVAIMMVRMRGKVMLRHYTNQPPQGTPR